MLLRLAWRQSLIRLLLFYAVAIGLGFWLGEPWWALGLATALDLGQVNYFTNGFRTRTQGFDIVVSHRADTGVGRFNTSLAVNYNKTKVIDRRSIVLSAIRPTDTRVLSLIDNTRKGNIEDNNQVNATVRIGSVTRLTGEWYQPIEEDRRWFRVSGETTLVTSAMLARSVSRGRRGLFWIVAARLMCTIAPRRQWAAAWVAAPPRC